MVNLGYDTSFDSWDWAKDLFCIFYTNENIEIWVVQITYQVQGYFNHVPIIFFSSEVLYLLMNTYISTTNEN